MPMSGGNGRVLVGSTDMDLVRSVVVFDAADLGTESAFWAGPRVGTKGP